jgi:uncharacterized membrane protein
MKNLAFSLLSAVAAVLWLGIIGLLHFIKPELDPRTRMISEYACGPGGWAMQLAFICIAISCWTLAAATWTFQPVSGPALLVVCGVGFACAGIFVTDPVLPTEQTQTLSGALHILFAFAVMLIFPVMATWVSWNVSERAFGATTRALLLALAASTWGGLFGFIAATVRSLRRPGTSIGYFERVLVVAYTAWLTAAALMSFGMAWHL